MSWGLWGLRTAADDVYHQIDEWGNHARDGHWDYADPDVDSHMNGNCRDWALAHQGQNPHLRIGQEWRWQEPEERDHPEDEWIPIHAFTHDDHWAYDVRGAFPLADWRKWKGWDDVTFNHEPWEIGGGNPPRRGTPGWPLHPPTEELVSRNKPKPPLPVTPEMVEGDDGWHVAGRTAMAWDEWAPKIQGGCKDGCDHDRMVMGEYSIDHPDGTGPQVGDLLPGIGGRSLLQFTHDTDQHGNPEMYVSGIHVDENHRRDGIAEALMRRMRRDHPDTPINPGFTTDDGQGLLDGLKKRIPQAGDALVPRFAAVTQNLVDRLHDEFKDWHRQQPKGSIFGGGMIGGLNEWPNIERFLKDRYPAAHRGLDMGYEEAGHVLLDGHSPMPYMVDSGMDTRPYETGPEAEATHGYDPKEIAAGMLLLHNKTDRFRGDMSQEDQARLNDIARKRFDMQRAHDRRNDRISARSPRVLYRGLKGVRFPNHVMDMIVTGHPEAGNAVLDHLNSINIQKEHQAEGLGVHWSHDPSVAHNFGGNYVNSEPHGVVIRGEWDWKGRRRIPGKDVIPSERETQLHPGTPLNVTGLELNLTGGHLGPDGWIDHNPNDWIDLPVSGRRMHASLDDVRQAAKPRGGDCYQAAGRYILDNPSADVHLVHADVTGRGPMEGVRMGHAWVEEGDDVIDNANGGAVRLPRDIYHALGDVRNAVRYTPAEAMAMMAEHEHFGPWHGTDAAQMGHRRGGMDRVRKERGKKKQLAAVDPRDAQQDAVRDVMHLHHYIQEGEHPDGTGTVLLHPRAHHPALTNHWAAEIVSPSPYGPRFGLRAQAATGNYIEALTGVARAPAPDAHHRLDNARNGLRVELQHAGHFTVPDLSQFSRLPRESDAMRLAAVNPRHDHGMEVPPPPRPGGSMGGKLRWLEGANARLAGYTVNCQRSCLALDGRHRGLNVEARPNYINPLHDPLETDQQWTDDEVADLWHDRHGNQPGWIDASDHFQLTEPGPRHWDAMTEHIGSWGRGARALIAMTQADPTDPVRNDPFRHVIMARVGRDGKVRYVDPQIARADASDWRDRILYGGHPKLFTAADRDHAASLTDDHRVKTVIRNRLYSPLRYLRIDDASLSPHAALRLVDRGTAGPAPIMPAEAVAAAREASGRADERASVAEDAGGYLVSFDDGGASIATMSRVWWWVDKATGRVVPLGSGAVSRLADTLRPLDL